MQAANKKCILVLWSGHKYALCPMPIVWYYILIRTRETMGLLKEMYSVPISLKLKNQGSTIAAAAAALVATFNVQFCCAHNHPSSSQPCKDRLEHLLPYAAFISSWLITAYAHFLTTALKKVPTHFEIFGIKSLFMTIKTASNCTLLWFENRTLVTQRFSFFGKRIMFLICQNSHIITDAPH